MTCRQCGATDSEHFFTSERDGSELSAACFGARKEKRLTKEKEQAGVAPTVEQGFRKAQAGGSTPLTSSTHPLDAWMR